jgi:hypothetical protein
MTNLPAFEQVDRNTVETLRQAGFSDVEINASAKRGELPVGPADLTMTKEESILPLNVRPDPKAALVDDRKLTSQAPQTVVQGLRGRGFAEYEIANLIRSRSDGDDTTRTAPGGSAAKSEPAIKRSCE